MKTISKSIFLLVIGYIFLLQLIIYLVLEGFSVFTLTAEYGLYFISCYTLFCFSAVYWLPDLLLLTASLRQPVWEEAQVLSLPTGRIELETIDLSGFQLHILEEEHPHVCSIALRTIIVSRGALTLLDPEELCALLTHELGHLLSMDRLASTALFVPLFFLRRLQGWIHSCAAAIVHFFRHPFHSAPRTLLRWAGYALLTGLVLAWLHALHYLVAFLVLLVAINGLERCFGWVWRWNTLLRDYHQDAFAHQLGYGPALRSALLKITRVHPAPPVPFFHLFTYDSNRSLYRRIHRLEKLASA